MAKYKIENAHVDGQFYYGMINGDYPNQFKTIRKNTSVYLFLINEITDDGVSISAPMDSICDVVPFNTISKIKSTSGEILSVFVYEAVTKGDLIENMSKDEPTTVFDENLREYAIANINIQPGGIVRVILDNDDIKDISELLILSKVMTFNGK